MIGIQAARIWQHPQQSASQILRLPAKDGARAFEGDAISPDADDGDGAGMIAANETLKPLPACAKFVGVELVSGRSRAGNEIGDADSLSQDRASLPGGEPRRRESRVVKRGPEPVTRPREVQTSRR